MDPYSFDPNLGFVGAPLASDGGAQDPSPPAAPAASATKTLKKGSACLHCRKRKLRCTGERPSCASCTKNRHVCEYEDPNLRPKGRVRQLEDKIATLERYLTSGGPPPPAPPTPAPTSSFPYPSARERRASNPPPVMSAQESFTLTLEGLFKMEGIMEGADAVGFDPTQPAAFSFGQGAEGQRTGEPYFPEQPQQPSWGSGIYGTERPADEMFIAGFSPPSTVPVSSTTTDATAFFSPPATTRMSDPAPVASNTWSPWLSLGADQLASGQTGSETGRSGLALPTEWNDDTALSVELRAHILQLFFQRRRQFALVLSVKRFFASLNGPVESQPRPELLFAMYACAARFSPLQHVVDAEERFADQAQRHIKLSLRWHRDGIQVVQASNLLALYFYSRGIYAEGWVQSGVTMRLVSTTGLNTIETGNFADYSRADPRAQSQVRRVGAAPFTSLGPPADPIELGERIWAFWTTYYLDRGGSSSTGWPEALGDKEILTPLPRPMEHYESDGYTIYPDRHLSDLFSPTSSAPVRPDGVGAVLIQALGLHHRISRIGGHPSIKTAHRATAPSVSPPSSSHPSPSDPNSSSSHHSSPEPAARPGPIPQILFDEEILLKKFVATMPPSATTLKGPGGIPPHNASRKLSTDQGSLDGAGSSETYGVHPIVFSLNTVLYTAFMVLYEEMAEFEGGSPDEYAEKASQAGVAAVSMVGSIIDIDFGELDLLLVFFWKNIARFLLERAKKLRKRGRDEEASLREIDVEVLVLSMRRFGEVWTLGDSQALLLEKFQTLGMAEDWDWEELARSGATDMTGRV